PGKGSTFTLWLPTAHGGSLEHAPLEQIALSGHDPRVQGLADAGEVLLRESGRILQGFVSRLRVELELPGVNRLSFAQLADHVATLLADLAAALVVLEETSGQPSSIIADGADIQRMVADRHGGQRARLGWSTSNLVHEYRILSEEVASALRHHLTSRDGALDDALGVLTRLLAQAERTSRRAHDRTREAMFGGAPKRKAKAADG
ncbi:MAG TPA: hypothetical protein VEA99_12365, partial [Gemmatimonadaceae bacterium]|nr:hypothetical protein [Gemmatimonadaceae bacterium]